MHEKVKHLPHVKRQLEQLYNEIVDDMKRHLYNEALQKINILIKQQFTNEPLYKNKLVCLAKLEHWDDVEYLAEKLMSEGEEGNSNFYFFYYILSLYYIGQYELVVELIDDKRRESNFQNEVMENLINIYNESKRITEEKVNEIYNRLQMAIISKNESEQWLLFHQWKKLNVAPSSLIFHMLESNQVHPFVKTYILYTLKETEINRDVTIIKNNDKVSVNISDLQPLLTHPIYQETIKHIDHIEQNNPTLYSFVLQLLQRYFEYIYPFLYNVRNTRVVAQAALMIARAHLNGEVSNMDEENTELNSCINQIEQINEAFFRLTIT